MPTLDHTDMLRGDSAGELTPLGLYYLDRTTPQALCADGAVIRFTQPVVSARVPPMKNLHVGLVLLLAGCGIPDEDDLLSGISLSPDAFSQVGDAGVDGTPDEDVEELDVEADGEVDVEVGDVNESLDASSDALVDGESDGESEGGFPGTVPALVAGTIEKISSPKGISIQPSVALDDNLESLLVFTGAAVNTSTLSIWGKREGGEPFALHPADDEKRNEPTVCALAGGGEGGR